MLFDQLFGLSDSPLGEFILCSLTYIIDMKLRFNGNRLSSELEKLQKHRQDGGCGALRNAILQVPCGHGKEYPAAAALGRMLYLCHVLGIAGQ